MIIRKQESFVVLANKKFKHAAGISTFKGILILWDEDFDQRIFDFIKNNLDDLRQFKTIGVSESHGQVDVYCNLDKDFSYVNVGEDSWCVNLINIYREDELND